MNLTINTYLCEYTNKNIKKSCNENNTLKHNQAPITKIIFTTDITGNSLHNRIKGK